LRKSLGTRTSRRSGVKAIPSLGHSRVQRPASRLKEKIAAWRVENPDRDARHTKARSAQAKFQAAIRAL
jgi:hypothetical protein